MWQRSRRQLDDHGYNEAKDNVETSLMCRHLPYLDGTLATIPMLGVLGLWWDITVILWTNLEKLYELGLLQMEIFL